MKGSRHPPQRAILPAMSWDQILGLLLAVVAMGAFALGSLVPGFPGTALVLAVAAVHRLWFGATGVGNVVLVILVMLTVGSLFLDYVASVAGAKRFGASGWGIAGAVIGGMVGLMWPLPGLIVGPFAGAMLLEMIAGREWKEAARAGLGAVIGFFAGAVGRFAVAVAMVALFVFNVIQRSWR